MLDNRFLVNEKVALLDKCHFSGALIEDIADIPALVKQNIVEVNTGKLKYITKSMKEFSKLSLQDNMVDSFVNGMCAANYRPYGILQTSIKSNGCGNLKCYSVAEYKEHIEKLKKHLFTHYGITVNFTGLRFRQVEINRTFRLDGEFNEYCRVFKLLTELSQKMNRTNYFKEKKICKDFYSRNKYGTFYAKTRGKKNYMQLKIYDKKGALIGVVVLSDNWVRFEFTLVGSSTIKRAFKTDKLYELTDEQVKKELIEDLAAELN